VRPSPPTLRWSARGYAYNLTDSLAHLRIVKELVYSKWRGGKQNFSYSVDGLIGRKIAVRFIEQAWHGAPAFCPLFGNGPGCISFPTRTPQLVGVVVARSSVLLSGTIDDASIITVRVEVVVLGKPLRRSQNFGTIWA
jgi:hypothetical protein